MLNSGARFVLLIALVKCFSFAEALPTNCYHTEAKTGIVCGCNTRDCDWFDYKFPTKSGSAHLIETTKEGDRFKVYNLKTKPNLGTNVSDANSIKVDLSHRYQSIIGWGGAFTDSAAININTLSERVEQMLIESYFGSRGLQYNLGRVPIGGSDFSERAYTYDDQEGNKTDYDLIDWSLADEDLNYKLPLIKKAYKMTISNMAGKLKLFGSPWSPPAWMKDNHNITRGHLIDDDKIYKTYATYLVRFYAEYQKRLGFDLWGGTIQNEPGSSDSPFYSFNSLQMDAYQAIKFIGQYLGPALERNGFTKDKFNLMVGDDSLGVINHQAPKIMADKDVQRYVSGLAFHWYESGWQVPYDTLDDCFDQIQDKIDFVLMTEACNGFKKGQEPAVVLGSWERGESYAVDIIQDLLRHSAGWVDWNLALDMKGGPNWVNNTVDSPIIVEPNSDTFYKQPMYYVLGHFSRFFLPGSVRVGTTPLTRDYEDSLLIVAVHNDDLGIVAINMLNRLNTTRKISLDIKTTKPEMAHARHSIPEITLAARSISTVTFKL